MAKMMFTENKPYNEMVYEAGKVYDIPDSHVDRWLKRGGQLVQDKMLDQVEELANDVNFKDSNGETPTGKRTHKKFRK
jgi:hypothetical protein